MKECVDAILRNDHVALLGAGGVGKTSISKVILHEKDMVSRFQARVFVSYDGIASSAMTFELFLERIADAIGVLPDSKYIIERLESAMTLLVLDNTETFLDASPADFGKLTELLDTIGALPSTSIIATTRNPETVPPNLPFYRAVITGLTLEAASAAFSFVYKLAPIDDTIQRILSALDYHPLSINILANTATINQWTVARLQEAWREGQSRILDSETSGSKYRSLRISIELSIACPLFQATKDVVLRLLRIIAFLPQGLYREDLHGILQDRRALGIADALCRSSLAYWLGDRITMLAPIRLYIMDVYNSCLRTNDDGILFSIHRHYHEQLSNTPEVCAEREHANLDRLLFFDISSETHQSEFNINLHTLRTAGFFLHHIARRDLQATSLWPLLTCDVDENLSRTLNPLSLAISLCLSWVYWLEYYQCRYATSSEQGTLQKSTLSFSEQLSSCLRVTEMVHNSKGNLLLADEALRQGCCIARSMNHFMYEAFYSGQLCRVALCRGNIEEADSFATSANNYFQSTGQYLHLIGLSPDLANIAIHQQDFDRARSFLHEAMALDREYNDGRRKLEIVNNQASIEGWAGDVTAALKVLDDSMGVDVRPGAPQFSEYLAMLRATAYYEANMGNLSDARTLLSRATSLSLGSHGAFSHSYTDLISAYVDLFDGEYTKSRMRLHSLLDNADKEDIQHTAILYRALGEVMLSQEDISEATTHFGAAKSLCSTMGISPTYLYAGYRHWYTLPEQYLGWKEFLAMS